MFGSNLKKLREEKGLTQNELAEKLSISRQSISKWELNIAIPPITFLIPLTKILECSLEDLLKENSFKV